MVKGIKKNMIVLRRPESRWFEEAYFILKEDTHTPSDTDILAEANRILSENATEEEKGKNGRTRLFLSSLFFLAGVLTGAALSFLFLF